MCLRSIFKIKEIIINRKQVSFIEQLKAYKFRIYPTADISTFEEEKNAYAAGIGFIGTSLSIHTEESKQQEGPDWDEINTFRHCGSTYIFLCFYIFY
ncbi:hypothetical protein [Enterococcus sp. DIV0421]|uniref:hypothetical protein n=1 Tax=Enterococcus sp. DIV0421 TaxID=2774688 RepID=UPI003F683DCE